MLSLPEGFLAVMMEDDLLGLFLGYNAILPYLVRQPHAGEYEQQKARQIRLHLPQRR